VLFRRGQAGHVAGPEAQGIKLRLEGLAVVDGVVRAHPQAPVAGFIARRGGDHGQAGQRLGDLDQNRADSAGAADDQQALAGAFTLAQAHALEQQFPGGDRRQRQGRRLGMVEGLGFAADDALIDDVQLAVGAGAPDGAGVEHVVAGLKQGDAAADRLDRAGGVPAENLVSRFRFGPHADLGVDRVDGDGGHLDQQVVRAEVRRRRVRQIDVFKRFRVVDG